MTTDLDVWNPAQIHGATHITEDERSRLRHVFDAGFVDAFRALHPDDPGFSWWDYRAGHFHKGFGLRIDMVMATADLAGAVTAAVVDREFRKPTRVPESKPSDHTALVVDLDVETSPGASATDDPLAALESRPASGGQLGLF